MKTYRGFDSLVDDKEGNVVITFAILNSHITEKVGERGLSERCLFQEVSVRRGRRGRRMGVHGLSDNELKMSRKQEETT